MTEPVFFIRRAREEDAEAIHSAHMRSIRETCAPSYTPEEIRAWGGRDFDRENRIQDIRNDLVWVIEKDGSIYGFAHLEFPPGKPPYVKAFYFCPEAQGKGLGKKLMDEMMAQAHARGARKITLHSSLNALRFYEKLGFKKTRDLETVNVNGTEIRCIPMERNLI